MKKVLSLIAILCMALVFCAGCDYFSQSTTKPPCEHDWVDATCTEPKTCSVCGETEGEALGHNAIEVFGQAPTCTEPGQTNFVYCDVCDKNLSEAKEIAPLGHTEETVAGQAATCTEPGMTDGKKCSVCGVVIAEQTVIDALGHKPEADDGDVTTPVKCANEGCGEILVAAKEAITLTIPTFENGAVVADKKNYAIGDTVKLTLLPEFGYAQKLTINGEPLILDWNNNIYTFVAEKNTYVLEGTFEKCLNLAPSDAARWETGNQAHGILTTYYPANNDSWWMVFNGNYNSLSVRVQNHFPIGETKDNFFVYLRVTMENGKIYLFRIGTDKGGYTAYNRAGIQNPGDASADWGNWKNLSKLDSKITSEGVEFKVERQGANTLVLTVDGEVVDTYTMKGITAEDKIASVDVKHQGNKGEYVDIAYLLTLGCDHTWDAATCTAPKTCSICKVTVGEKLGHTAGEDVVENNKAADCLNAGSYDKVVYCTVCGAEAGRETVVVPAIGHKDENADYKCDVCGANLCTNHVPGTPVVENEVAPDFDKPGSYENVTYCTVCGIETSRDTVPVPAKEAITLTIPTFENGAVTADKKNYAIGDTVTLTIAPAGGYFQKLYINGEPLLLDWKTKVYSFVAEKDTYVISGSFEPTLEVYAGDWGRWDNGNQAHGILSAYYPNENDAWWFKIKGDYSSFAINAKNYREIANSYEGGPDGGWRIALYMQLDNGNYYAFSMWIDKDHKYAYNHYGGKIAGDKESVTTWSGAWRDLAVVNPEATAALNGNGAEFKLERIDGNHIRVTFGDTVLETYEIPGVTAANKVVSVGLHHWGNKGARVEIPFALTVPTVEEEPPVTDGDVTLNIGEFANGTVTADKESYKIGETVTLTLAPNAGYFQQLYINGEPLILDWKSKVYSFVAEENKYEITGNFVKEYSMNVYDWGRWDNYNQAHGLITTYYPNANDSWWMNFNGEYESIAVTVKNHMPQEDSPAFSHVLRMTIGGKFYAFRIFAENGKYCYGRFGSGEGKATTGMEGDWSHWKDLSNLASAINGEGVVFKITRTGANELTITINDVVVDTYTIAGVTADTKVESVGMIHYGNKGQKVQIPFEVK